MQSYTRVVGTVSCSRCRFSMSGHFRDNRSPTMSLDAVRRTCDIASNVSGTCLARRLHEAANALLYNVVDYVDQGINIMSIFGTILSKIFPSSHPRCYSACGAPCGRPNHGACCSRSTGCGCSRTSGCRSSPDCHAGEYVGAIELED